MEARLLQQLVSRLNELEQFNNLNVQVKDDELQRTRNDLAEAQVWW